MSTPYDKYDVILKRNLRPRERMGDARAAVRFALGSLEQFDSMLRKLPDDVSEEALLALCEAADNALYAAMNAKNMGIVGYVAKPVKTVEWMGK